MLNLSNILGSQCRNLQISEGLTSVRVIWLHDVALNVSNNNNKNLLQMCHHI